MGIGGTPVVQLYAKLFRFGVYILRYRSTIGTTFGVVPPVN